MGYSNNIPGKFWTYLIPKPGMVVVVVSAAAVVFLCLKHIFNGVFRGWWYPWNQSFNYLSFHIITLWDLYWCHYMHSQDIYSPIIFLLESFQFPAKSGCLIFDLRLPDVGESSNCAAWRKTLATTGRRWWVVLILRYFKAIACLDLSWNLGSWMMTWDSNKKMKDFYDLTRAVFFLQRLVIWRVRNSKQGYGMTNRGWDEEQKGRWTIYPPWN